MLTQDSFATYATPLLVLVIIIEFAYSIYSKKSLYSSKETLTNIYLTTLNVGANLLVRGFYLFIYGYFYDLRFFQIENVFLYWFVLVILEDFFYYLLHLVDHTVRLFWSIHVTHHSSTEFNLTTGFRSSVFQPFYRFAYFIPIALMGYSPVNIMLIYSITQIWGIFVHTKTIGKLPRWFAYIFVTPSHHRVHHGSNLIYLDKNMGMMLIIWDRIFGTFQEEVDDTPIDYGLMTNPTSRGPVNIVFHEIDSIIKDVRKKVSFKAKLKYIFAPPGWSHDGSTMTTKQMLEAERINKMSHSTTK